MAVLLVHGAAADTVGGDKGDDAAGAYLINGFGEEIVVDQQIFLVIAPVHQLVAAEGDVSDSEIKKTVRELAFLKALDGDIGVGVKLLGNAPGDAVQFHAVQAGRGHALRQQAEEVADAAGGLQNIAALEAHVLHRLIDGLDNGGPGVVCVEGGCPRRSVLRRGKGRLQLQKFLRPARFIRVKGVRQAAPAHITGQNLLLGGGGGAALQLNALEGVDGLHVAAELLFLRPNAQIIVSDAEIPGGGGLIRLILHLFGNFQPLHHNFIGEMVRLRRIDSSRFRGILLGRGCFRGKQPSIAFILAKRVLKDIPVDDLIARRI